MTSHVYLISPLLLLSLPRNGQCILLVLIK